MVDEQLLDIKASIFLNMFLEELHGHDRLLSQFETYLHIFYVIYSMYMHIAFSYEV